MQSNAQFAPPMKTETKASLAAIEIASPLYDQIVDDFLKRAAADDAIPGAVVKHLKAAFAAGPPKLAVLIDAFGADDDLK